MQGYPLVDKRPTYSLTKSSGTLAIQILADSIAAEDMQVLSFHPGAVYGAVWEEEGVTEDMFPFDDGGSSFVNPGDVNEGTNPMLQQTSPVRSPSGLPRPKRSFCMEGMCGPRGMWRSWQVRR
jgi:hypothetical protein